MTLLTPAQVFKSSGKIYTTRKGTKTKYVSGVRYIWSNHNKQWQPSIYQDRNRNVAEQADHGL